MALLPAFGRTHCAEAASPAQRRSAVHAQQLSAFGPRPVDSPAHRKLQAYIAQQIRAFGCAVEQDVFTAQTPIGPKRMNNIIAQGSRAGEAAGRT